MTRVRLPGLVDVHTHLRVPGGEHKEDFATGTAAALAGGVTQVLAMPNTQPPLTTPAVLNDALGVAAAQIRCDVGLYAGASATDMALLPDTAAHAVALKIYLNDTFGKLRVDELPVLMAAYRQWPADRPIALHAEKQSVAVAIGLAAAFDRPIHIVHVSRREEIELIAAAKARGLPVTCEVSPHHLVLTRADYERIGPRADMRPVLASADDVAALWDHINDTVDCIATDHAPHTLAEKAHDPPPPGVPGLETSLRVMLTQVAAGKLTLARLEALMATNPRRIFGLPAQPDTYIEVDVDAVVTVPERGFYTRCNWSPFSGMALHGVIERVVLRGKTVFAAGNVLAEQGSGRLIMPADLVGRGDADGSSPPSR